MDKKYLSDSKRVILVTGDGSKWYEQIIFITRKNTPKNELPVDFIKEAEKIIGGFMPSANAAMRDGYLPDDDINPAPIYGPALKNEPPNLPINQKKSRFNSLLNSIIFVTCVALAVMLINIATR